MAQPGATGPGCARRAKRVAAARRRPLGVAVRAIALCTVSMQALTATPGDPCAEPPPDTTIAAPQQHRPDSSGTRRPMKRLDAPQRQELLEAIKARAGDSGERGADR